MTGSRNTPPAAGTGVLPGSCGGSGAVRFILCGSAGDGKSTLLDRLLQGSKTAFESRRPAAEAAPRYWGIRGTGDIECFCFETAKRKFAAIQAPDSDHYMRNMAARASQADLGLILVDARKGMLPQTRRYSHIVSLMGIRQAVLAVNKMDTVGHEQGVFRAVADEFSAIARELGIETVTAVPVSALTGENLFARQGSTPWYRGPTLVEALEDAGIDDPAQPGAFRLPVGWVNRPGPDVQGYGGAIASGRVERGMPVVAGASKAETSVERILGPSGDLEQAVAGQSVALVLADDIDISRGDMIATRDRPPKLADQFAVHVIWMDASPMLPERPYLARFAGTSAVARITDLAHRVDIGSTARLAAKTLAQNEIGYCKLALDRPVPFDPYPENRRTGAFELADRYTDAVVGAGMIRFALRRAGNVAWRQMKIDKAARAQAIGQTPCVLWLTGLPGAGKSTIADRLEQKLQAMGKHTYLLDGDNVRHGLSRDLGFTDRDRVENIRRVAEVARMMVDAGLIVIASFISPFRSEREMARDLFEEGEFFEIFVDTPLDVCEARDPKGLYARARRGGIANFTGIDSPYEPPEDPDLRIDTTKLPADRAADEVVRLLKSGRGGLPRTPASMA